MSKKINTKGVYQRIYAVVTGIPFGHVATYGQIAELVEGANARMVGYAMAALPSGTDVPWQRVINRKGEISRRKGGMGEIIQRRLLEYEGVEFDRRGRIDLAKFVWRERGRQFCHVPADGYG